MGSSPSPALGLILRPPPNPGGVYLSCVSLSTSQNPSFVSSSVVSSSQRIWVGSKGPSLFRSSLNSMNWWHNGFVQKKFRAGTGIRSQLNDELFNCTSTKGDLGTNAPSKTEPVEVKGSVVVSEYKPIPDLEYLQELLAIQQQGPRAIGFFGTRNMGFMHQQLIEILSYAMVITKNHIYTSGASGTNAAVIRGALRAEKPELLTVILPQSLSKQPPESQELLAKVKNLIEKPQYDHLPLIEASRLCNMDIISKVQQVICFAFHDSKLIMETCQEAKNLRKIVTLFYLD
ncbi:hypothetical protein FCM35_KLT18438 [Carex littledalei]|uniref:Uncharacterized protein n=1 Tax=Carex littledalei TaxID=544730 RepID=A0A833RL87_9POAL|nr:hypothetical protein FCM35_KLT18438 [Carex littledalei]